MDSRVGVRAFLSGARSDRRLDTPRIIFNTDGDKSLSSVPQNMDLAGFYEVVDELAGTQVDVLSYSVNTGGDTYCHCSHVAPILGADLEDLDGLPEWVGMKIRCIRALHAHGVDPLRAMAARAHERGMQFWASLRMNDNHDDFPGYEWLHGSFRTSHPHLLIGSPHPDTDVYEHLDLDFCWACNYAEQEVRHRQLALVRELLEGYGVDGIELDFLRGRRYFRDGEASQGADGLTELVRSIAREVRGAPGPGGRPRVLAARVDRDLYSCQSKGLEVARWIEEGCLDFVIPMSSGRLDMEAHLAEFVSFARTGNCRVAGGLEPRAYGYGNLPAHDSGAWRHATIEMLRAAAMGYFEQGAASTYLFNFEHRFLGFDESYTTQELQALREIGKRETLRLKDKQYTVTVDQNTEFSSRTRSKEFELPAMLTEESSGRSFTIWIGDDIQEARAKGLLRGIFLRITTEPCERPVDGIPDGMLVKVNGKPADRERSPWRPRALVYLNPEVRQGMNRIRVALGPSVRLEGRPLVLTGIEILLRFTARRSGCTG